MRKLFLSVAVAAVLFSCSNEENNSEMEISNNSVTSRNCASNDVLEAQLKENPQLAVKMAEIENFTESFLNNPTSQMRLVNGSIEIPVVVNVLYNSASENISLAQIQSQIDILNQDFNGNNPDFNQVPSLFSGVKADIGISFVLDNVIRKSTRKSSWGTRDAMKSSKRGGIDATSPDTKLNIWVCTIGGGILGYAQFPGGSSSTDGVVIDSRYFGNTGTATAPFDKGRTATHEIGHWMNLRHIWGDTTCGTDYVADTPTHNTANYGCPSYPHYSTCSGTPVEMTMNYMDYTDDACMYMFTNGQKSRMMAIFAAGGPRETFAQP
ncbi:zinc metalloprotease [Flavobacterium sp. NRK F10]|uniref:Zinc metalloprotease n=1 Tax=Flavobacterium sediminis TaxID=2201181 RepID=A0A2U8QYC5_9FLAO|nr:MULTISPECIES: zinc metalloprotease [Flavobacterium]AWM14916.1 zinc metalloprotease [Flavobacterium sediminis]MCO6176173.1 zinc metalloprotease [Flavobacterium sp. NRK F10]